MRTFPAHGLADAFPWGVCGAVHAACVALRFGGARRGRMGAISRRKVSVPPQQGQVCGLGSEMGVSGKWGSVCKS